MSRSFSLRPSPGNLALIRDRPGRRLQANAIAAVSVTSVLLLGGCGGSDDEEKAETPPETQAEPAAVERQDAEARSNARTLATEVETCFVDQQDYTACQEPEGTELPLGSDAGKVEVAEADVAEFTIVAHSESGNVFTITKGPDGALKRTCEAAGSEDGGCSEGTW